MSFDLRQGFRLGPWKIEPLRGAVTGANGQTQHLEPKVMDVLVCLAAQPNGLATRNQLLEAVWSEHAAADELLTGAVSDLRKALQDDRDASQYIETVPKRGYRLIGQVRPLEDTYLEEQVTTGSAAASMLQARRRTLWAVVGLKRRTTVLTGLSALMALAVIVAVLRMMPPPPPPTISSYTQLTKSSVLFPPTLSPFPLLTDGSRIYFSEWLGGQFRNRQISVKGGEMVPFPSPFDQPTKKTEPIAITPDGAHLLMQPAEFATGLPFRLWPVLGGLPRRLGEIDGHAAAYSPDGTEIVYINGRDIYVARSDASEARKIVTAPGRAYWPRVSPDGNRIRFTVTDNRSGLLVLWEASADGSDLRPLLSEWGPWPNHCCGDWTPDGNYYVFQGTRNDSSQIWAIREQSGLLGRRQSEPVQLTPGPLEFIRPVISPDGEKIFAVGWQLRGEVVRYDSTSGQFVPHLASGVSVEWLEYSRDGQQIAYVTYPEADLWRARSDGSDRLQLTFSPMRAFSPEWAPDGKTLAFVGQLPGQHWKVYLVAAEGGTAKPITPDDRREHSPTWSPDGLSLAFSLAGENGIYVFDLASKSLSKIEGSEGLHDPSWSPGGKYIAAHSIDHQRLFLFDTAMAHWEKLLESDQIDRHYWSASEQYLYFNSSFLSFEPLSIYRARIREKVVEQISSLSGVRPAWGIRGIWVGVTPEGSPLLIRDLSIHHIYALDWERE